MPDRNTRMDALAFLDAPAGTVHPVYAVAGDEDFLRRRAVARLQDIVLDGADPAFAFSPFPADSKPDFSTVRNELATAPFLSPRRLVVVEGADAFVTAHRAALEKYALAPSPVGVLVLEVKTWPATTKLAKLLAGDPTIACAAPKPQSLPRWCGEWSKSRYGKKLAPGAGQLLADLVGPHLGVLDQELAKLACFVGARGEVTPADVDAVAGRNASANVFKILEAVGDGDATTALAILGTLLGNGEEPVGLFAGPLASQLRRIAQAGSLVRQGVPTQQALDRAGVAKWPAARDAALSAMRHLGVRRLGQLFGWLVETDLGMKGGSPLPQRLVLERFLVRLAQPRAASPAAPAGA